MDKIKQNLEEIKNKEEKEEKLKKQAFEKALRDLIEKKYDLSSETVKDLLKLKFDLSNSQLKEMLENSSELKNLNENDIKELEADIKGVKDFKEKFIDNFGENFDKEEDFSEDISEIFDESSGKISKAIFSQKFIQDAKNGKIVPGVVVGTTNSGEKVIKLGVGITVGFLKSFYDLYMIISGKGEYKREI